MESSDRAATGSASRPLKSYVARQVRIPKAAELIARQLRRQIVTGELNEGDTLPAETLLLAQLNVSRPTLREAYRVLESEGLLSVRRGARGGAEVHAPRQEIAARYVGLVLQSTMAAVPELVETRDALELAAVRLAAERSRRDKVQALQELCRLASEEHDAERQLSLLHRFHRELVRLSENRGLILLCDIVDHLMGQLSQSVLDATRSRSESHNLGEAESLGEALGLEEAREAHEEVLNYVERHDANGAEHVWRRHLEQISKRMHALSDNMGPVDFLDYPGYD